MAMAYYGLYGYGLCSYDRRRQELLELYDTIERTKRMGIVYAFNELTNISAITL